MDDKVQKALTTGVIVRRQGGDGNYHCVPCGKAVTELQPHLNGKDHWNHFVWHTLGQPQPSASLLDEVPSVVWTARLNNELKVEDKAFLSYRCLVCPKKQPFNGIRPLEEHLNGSQHKKAREANAASLSASPTSPPPTHPTHPTHPIHHPATPYPPSPPTTQSTYHPVNSLQYHPSTNRYSQPSQPSYTHPHPQFPPQTQPNPTPQPQYISGHQYPPNAQLPVSTQSSILTRGPQQTSSPSPVSFRGDVRTSSLHPDCVSKEILPGEVESVLRDGVVVRGAGTFFKCVACDKEVTGLAPLREHLKSDKHRRKVQAHTLPDINTLSLVSDGRAVRQQVELESVALGVGRDNRQVYEPAAFQWTVVTSTPPHQPSNTVYRNLSMPRGLVLIFNYYFTELQHERHGAKHDSVNLETLFRRMGYQVYLYEDFTKTQTKDTIRKLQENPFLHQYDSLIVFVLSHGKEDTQFLTLNEDIMSLDEVRYCFTDVSCPALMGKPKLFFVNFCRGSCAEPHMQFDGLAMQQVAPRDMVTVYACINKFQAPRDPKLGTIFVHVLCEVLAAHAHDTELRDLYNIVSDKVLSRGGSTPELQNFGFNQFYFNPAQ